ncbi:MAG: flagellar filament capping protein FliD [bacterium]
MTSSITFAGSGSGLPVSDWITAMVASERAPVDALYTKKDTYNATKTALSSIQSDFSALRTSIQKLTDGNIASSFDLFASRTATSSDTNISTVTAANNTSVQKVTLSVDNLATATKATSSDLSKSIDGTELFTAAANKQGTLTATRDDGTVYGNFSIYVNGAKNEFTIEKTDTLNTIVKKINDKFDQNSDGDYSDNNVKASIVDGKMHIDYNNTAVTKLTLGSNSDTTNFFNIMQLSTASSTDNGDGTSGFASLSKINKINLGGTIVGNTANLNVDSADPVTAGTFKIGGTEFTIDSKTSLATLISKINSSDKAGVTAQIDTKTNKLVLTSKTPGKTAINFENGTSNFLTKIGLITATGDSTASQTLGENAKIHINGAATALEVNSNTVTGDVSGIPGLTINLKKTTLSKATDGSTIDTPIDINIDQNTDGIKTALNDFISKYNQVLNDVSTQTGTGQALHGEYSIVSLKNSLRSMASGQIKGLSAYDSLSMIGISTGSVGKSAKDTSSTFSLDSAKLLTALQDNPSEVKALLIGDKTAGITGVFQQLQTKLNSALDPVSGFFSSKSDSINTLISNTDKSITKGEDRITAYKALITKQFSDMDTYISKMQQSSSALSSIK